MPLPDQPEVPGRKEQDLRALIEQLSDSQPGVREIAAREIFWCGFARAAAIAGGWLGEPEIAECFVFPGAQASAEFPRTTVGIAVEPEAFDRIRLANGSPRLAEVPPDLDAKEFQVLAGNDVRLDILTTRDVRAEGAMARFLAKHGAGIQQVEWEVSGVDRVTELLGARFGLTPVYPAARAGADRTRVNFFLVANENGRLLIELVEAPGAGS